MRVEWKCNSLNEASKKAAVRLGFSYEATFLQHMMVKGQLRDTCWFSMIDEEWPVVKKEMERWLAPQNFDEQGVQKSQLRVPQQRPKPII